MHKCPTQGREQDEEKMADQEKMSCLLGTVGVIKKFPCRLRSVCVPFCVGFALGNRAVCVGFA